MRNKLLFRAAMAVLFALLVVLACNTVYALGKGVPLTTLWDRGSWTQIALILLPLLCILNGSRPVWIAAILTTLLVWGFYLQQILKPYKGGGADIGLGLLMLSSPIFILAVCALTDWISGRVRQADD